LFARDSLGHALRRKVCLKFFGRACEGFLLTSPSKRLLYTCKIGFGFGHDELNFFRTSGKLLPNCSNLVLSTAPILTFEKRQALLKLCGM
jgi:hypothetical protein